MLFIKSNNAKPKKIVYSLINNKKTGCPNMIHPFEQIYEASKKALWAVAIFSFFINLAMLAVPIYMLQLYDRVIPSFSFDTLIYLSLIAISALIILGLLDAIRTYVCIRVSHWFDQILTPLTIEAIPRQFVNGDPSVLSYIKDSRIIKNFIASPVAMFIFDAPWTPFYFLIIFMLHPLLGAISLGGAVILIILGIMNDKAVRSYHVSVTEKSRIAEDQLQMTLRHADTIIAMGMMPTIMNRYFLANEALLSVQSQVNEKNATYKAIVKSIRLILQLLILGVGAYLTLLQEITSGAMIASSILLSKALSPIEQLVGSWRSVIDVLEAYRRLYQFLKHKKEEPLNIQLPKPRGHLVFEHVSFMHTDGIHKILDNIHFDIKPGEFFVILGASGAGKTTLARLMLGIIPTYSGHVRLDGADVYEWTRVDFGRHVGYLPQNVSLFRGTVAENIGRLKDIDDEKVIHAAKKAGVHDMILQLPKGYQTVLLDNQLSLSGGQMQRIGLARALYGDVRLLVLDEPNAHLDESGLQALMTMVKEAKSNGVTVVLITHYLPIAMLSDRCVYLNRGKIDWLDTPERLSIKLKLGEKSPIV
jgi:PrtD family type I secretion system ABC transporter